MTNDLIFRACTEGKAHIGDVLSVGVMTLRVVHIQDGITYFESHTTGLVYSWNPGKVLTRDSTSRFDLLPNQDYLKRGTMMLW